MPEAGPCTEAGHIAQLEVLERHQHAVHRYVLKNQDVNDGRDNQQLQVPLLQHSFVQGFLWLNGQRRCSYCNRLPQACVFKCSRDKKVTNNLIAKVKLGSDCCLS